ncbi:hypothetical protein HDU86_002570 [Geranomyces michiganensis]|nr:hypothetical protein HDU86_002570 [Geranomyces michiganensis]
MTSTVRAADYQVDGSQSSSGHKESSSSVNNNRNTPRNMMGVEPFRVGSEIQHGQPQGQQRPPPAPHALLIEPKQHLKLKSSTVKEKPAPRIGPYVVGRRLGEGSTGYVKLGVHQTTGVKVAIKIIGKASLMTGSSSGSSPSDPPASDDPPMTPTTASNSNQNTHMRKLEREIAIMKLIKHENIVQILDVYESDSELFLILEYTEGGELFDYMVTKGKLSHYETVVFLQQIMNAVEYCQRYNICHRDLKPENILLDKDNNIKIADFGMASIQGPGQMLETSCGSPHYASPEIIRGVKYDGAKSDIWSCGVIFFAMVTGRLPFDNDNIRKVLMMVKNGTYFIPKTVAPDAADLIKRMLVVDPWKRITIEEILKHPFMTSTKTRVQPNPPMAPPAPLNIASVAEIEPEILESLAVLGWTDERRLVGELTSQEDNQAKHFYHLMLQRRADVLEDYQQYETSSYAGNPKRRGSSYMCLSAGPGSPLASPWSSRAELVGSRSELRPTTATSGESGSGANDQQVLPRQKSRAELRREVGGGAGPTPTTPGGGMDRVGDKSADVFRSSTIATTSSPDAPRRAAVATSKTSKDATLRPLQITIPTNDASTLQQQQAQYLGSHASLTSQGPLSASTTPGPSARGSWTTDGGESSADEEAKKLDITRFHRCKQASGGLFASFCVVVVTHTFLVAARMTGPPTPTINSPKRSLLSSMFNFKPAPIHIVSSVAYEQTQMVALTLLASFGMKSVEQANNGGWNCTGEYFAGSMKTNDDDSEIRNSTTTIGGGNGGANAGLRKSIKFHVGIALDPGADGVHFVYANDGSRAVRVTLTQTQGSNSAFKNFGAAFTKFFGYGCASLLNGGSYDNLFENRNPAHLEHYGLLTTAPSSGAPAHSRSSNFASTNEKAEKAEKTPL